VRLNEAVINAVQANGLAGSRTVLDPTDPVVLVDAGALERFLSAVLTGAAGLVSTDRIGIVTAQRWDRPGWVEFTVRGLPNGVALPVSDRATREVRGASTEMRSGTDGDEFVLCLPLFTLWLSGMSTCTPSGFAEQGGPPLWDERSQ
jgi:hypothetical protein